MPLTEFEKDLIRGKNYVGTVHDPNIQKAYHPLPKITNMTSVRDSIVTCTVCRGERMVYIRHFNGHINGSKCPNCNGSGLMPSRGRIDDI